MDYEEYGKEKEVVETLNEVNDSTIKAYPDLDQCKLLEKILPIESADCHYVRQVKDNRGNHFDGKWSTPKFGNPNSPHADYRVLGFSEYETLPCWSLAALIDVLPSESETHKQSDEYKSYYYVESYMKRMRKEIYLSTERHENLVDACYEMIIKLHEQKLI